VCVIIRWRWQGGWCLNKSVVSIACSMIPMDDLVLFTHGIWSNLRSNPCVAASLSTNLKAWHCFPRLHSYILHLQHTHLKMY
jgi:hypothetical protein